VAPITATMHFSLQPLSIVDADNKLLHAKHIVLVGGELMRRGTGTSERIAVPIDIEACEVGCNARVDTMVVRPKSRNSERIASSGLQQLLWSGIVQEVVKVWQVRPGMYGTAE
jgi:hypothetical protein